MTTRIQATVMLTASLCCFTLGAVSGSASVQAPSVNAVVQQSEAAQAKPAVATATAKAAEPAAALQPARQAVNVRFDVKISYATRGGAAVTRTATLTVKEGFNGTLRAGNQVAVPSTTFAPTVSKSDTASTGQASPMVSYSYKSVGINLDARSVSVGLDGRVSAYLSVEFSAVDERATGSARPPSFPTFQQTFTLVFESGKPIVVARSNDVVDNVESVQMVEVTATILK